MTSTTTPAEFTTAMIGKDMDYAITSRRPDGSHAAVFTEQQYAHQIARIERDTMTGQAVRLYDGAWHYNYRVDGVYHARLFTTVGKFLDFVHSR